MKIAIITDGNNTLGMGHIYQSVTLAGFLSQRTDYKAQIFFMTKSDAKVTDLVTKSGYIVCHYPDDESILNSLRDEKPDRIIFDKLDVSPELAYKIKNYFDE